MVLPPLQSLEPLPPSGTDFGGLGEEAQFVEVEPEAKQEVLENKDVSFCGRAGADWETVTPVSLLGKDLTCRCDVIEAASVAPKF